MHWTAELEAILNSSEDAAEAEARLEAKFGPSRLRRRLEGKRTWAADAGETPVLHRAAFNGRVGHIKILLKCKSDEIR